MKWYGRGLVLFGLGLGLWGCAAGETVRVEPPKVERPVYFYVGVMELDLKSAPDPASSNTSRVTLNERVEKLERGGSWFQVRTADGRTGWANERNLKLDPITDFYVKRWGVRLRKAPQGKTITRLRLNDQVKLLEKDASGWARVTVARTQGSGWLELQYLSPERVVVRRVRRAKPGQAETTEATEAEAAPEPEKPGAPSGLGPGAAEAAPPPGETVPRRPKPRPEMFDPF
jgi:SH3-like domain-containing protein